MDPSRAKVVHHGRVHEAASQFSDVFDQKIGDEWKVSLNKKVASLSNKMTRKAKRRQAQLEKSIQKKISDFNTASEVLAGAPPSLGWPRRTPVIVEAAHRYRIAALQSAESRFLAQAEQMLDTVPLKSAWIVGIEIGRSLAYADIVILPAEIARRHTNRATGSNDKLKTYVQEHMQAPRILIKNCLHSPTAREIRISTLRADTEQLEETFAREITHTLKKTPELLKLTKDILDAMLRVVEPPPLEMHEDPRHLSDWVRGYKEERELVSDLFGSARSDLSDAMDSFERRFFALLDASRTEVSNALAVSAPGYADSFVAKIAAHWQASNAETSPDAQDDLTELSELVRHVGRMKTEQVATLPARDLVRENAALLRFEQELKNPATKVQDSLRAQEQKIFEALGNLDKSRVALDEVITQNLLDDLKILIRRLVAETFNMCISLRDPSEAETYVWLKRTFDELRKKGTGISPDAAGVTPERAQGLLELAALGCAALVIETDGSTVFVAEPLLDFVELGDLALSEERVRGREIRLRSERLGS